jgi:hypothetical protein
MSWVSLAPAGERAGHLLCVCDPASPPPDDATPLESAGVAGAAGVFALTVLTQALTTAILPVAGVMLAPAPGWATLPYALTLVGAGAATLPAALLTDFFGRRATMALGASLGIAGGAIAARGFVIGQFWIMALGAFWLGAAQGFGFFHRHGAATRAADKARAVALILGAGCGAALAAPALMAIAQAKAGPLAPAAGLMAAGALQVLTLAVVMASGPAGRLGAQTAPGPLESGRFYFATATAALAWFGMTRLMAHAAPAMIDCGVGESLIAGVVASHLVWMYAPAALAGPWVTRVSAGKLAMIGLAMIATALGIFGLVASALPFAALMALAGCGWSLAMLGATVTLHRGSPPSAGWLALHDGALFAAAVAGALSGAI